MEYYEALNPIIEYNGYWWMPKEPEHQYFGNLKVDKEGEIYLTIYGNSREDSGTYLNLDHNVLYGICEEGTKVTVFGKHRSRGIASEFYKSSIEYRYCLVGFHIDNPYLIKFKELILSINNLLGWFIDYEIQLMSKSKERTYIEDNIYEDDFRTVSIIAGNYESSSTRTRKTEIQRKDYLKVSYKESQPYYSIFEELKLISMLFSVLGRGKHRIQEILIPYVHRTIPNRAKLYFNNQTYFTPLLDWNIKNVHGRHIVRDNFAMILSNLYSLEENEKFILEVLSDKYLRRPGNERVEFFSIVSAFESWHRKNISEWDEENTEIYKSILQLAESSNELIMNWLKDRSILFRGKSLPKRIDYLIENDDWGLIADKKKFRTIITTTRNMIAHNLKKSKRSASLGEYIVIHNIVHLILEKLFLRSYGLPEEFIKLHFQKHPVLDMVRFQITSNRDSLRV